MFNSFHTTHLGNKQRVLLLVAALLAFMQLASIVHASQHGLSTSDVPCIAHLDSQQFSNSIPSTSFPNELEIQQVEQPLFQPNATLQQEFNALTCRGPPEIFQ